MESDEMFVHFTQIERQIGTASEIEKGSLSGSSACNTCSGNY